MLATPLQKLAFIIVKAREFDVQVPAEGLEDGSNGSDDLEVGILESTADNPTLLELRTMLVDLNDDQITEVVALAWVGRGDFVRAEWKDALAAATEAHNERTVPYLLETPNLGDLIEQGLAELGYSIIDEEEQL